MQANQLLQPKADIAECAGAQWPNLLSNVTRTFAPPEFLCVPAFAAFP
jgi:hypothetical protein